MAGSKTKEKVVQSDNTNQDVYDIEAIRLWAETLNNLMISQVIDEERSCVGSEPVYKNLFEEAEMYRLKGKLFVLLSWIDDKGNQ